MPVTNIGNTNQHSGSATLTGVTVPSGSLIVVGGAQDNFNNAGISVTDSAGNTYTAVGANVAIGSGIMNIFYCPNCLALSGGTITFHRSNSNADTSITAFYATNIATSAPLDSAVTMSGTAGPITSGTPTVSGELLVVFNAKNTSGTYTQDTTNGWVAPFSAQSASSPAVAGGNQISSAAKSFTFGYGGGSSAIIVGFKPLVVPQVSSPAGLARPYNPIRFVDVYPENVRRRRTQVTMGERIPFPLTEVRPPRFSRGAIEVPVDRPTQLRQRIQYEGALPPEHLVIFDALVREVLVADNAPLSLDALVREALVKSNSPVVFDAIIREALLSSPPGAGPIPLFPTLPYGFPVKVRPTMKTVMGTVKSGREIRVELQPVALWEIELLFEELRDQTQNDVPYAPFTGILEFENLVQTWLMMYGQTNVFAFDAPWDNSREGQFIGTGDGTTFHFEFFRTWGPSGFSIVEPVGVINQIFTLYENGTPVAATQYRIERDTVWFLDAQNGPHPPANGATITADFSFYYLCRFVADEQDFEEFSKARWTVPSLKFRSVYWPPAPLGITR